MTRRTAPHRTVATLAAVAMLTACSVGADDDPRCTTASEAAPAPGDDTPAAVPMAEPAAVGGFEFTVSGARHGDPFPGADWEDAEGRYVAVHITAKDICDSREDVSDLDMVLIAVQEGREEGDRSSFDPLDVEVPDVPDEGLGREESNPEETVDLWRVYDIPAGARGLEMQITPTDGEGGRVFSLRN